MASIHKRLKSPYWWAAYYREDGRRAQTSTRTTDRKTALRIAEELEDAHRGRATEGQMRRILSDLNERLTGQPLASATLRGFSTAWLERKRGEVELVSFRAYKGAVDDFLAATPAKADLGIQYTTVADIASWRDKSAARTTPRTANNRLKILRTFFQTAWRDGYIPENPAAKVQALASKEGIRRPFTIPELESIIGVADTDWRGMILTGLYTGQRLKDIASLTWTNVDMERGEIRLSTHKTGRRQFIPIAKSLRAHLESIQAGDNPRAPLFPTVHALGLRAGGSAQLSQQFHGILVDAGLAQARPSKRVSHGKGRKAPRQQSEISFHSLRHTATSLLKNAGVSQAVAADIIGHDSPEMSTHYTHIDSDTKRSALDKMPNIAVPKKHSSHA